MSFLYVTADKIGTPTGGGLVTAQEVQALEEFAQVKGEEIVKWGRDELIGGSDPWGWDIIASEKWAREDYKLSLDNTQFKLAHFYSGSFSRLVGRLKAANCKTTFTCAAHRVCDSKKAHEDLGIPYNYPHLTEKDQWKMYSEGYFDADVLIVPSKHSELVVNEQMDDLGITKRPKVIVIPHGCEVPFEGIKPLPGTFIVGYMGSVGCDKGLRYLLAAWKKLNYKNAILRLAGNESTSGFAMELIRNFGGGSIHCVGWQDKISNFYNGISLYVQSSATEGFGLEVLEAQAHGRVSLCSDHAGAADIVHESCRFPACNVDALAEKIDEVKTSWDLEARGILAKEEAKKYTWIKIRERYKEVWRNLLK